MRLVAQFGAHCQFGQACASVERVTFMLTARQVIEEVAETEALNRESELKRR